MVIITVYEIPKVFSLFKLSSFFFQKKKQFSASETIEGIVLN